jgi:hypothetical protein
MTERVVGLNDNFPAVGLEGGVAQLKLVLAHGQRVSVLWGQAPYLLAIHKDIRPGSLYLELDGSDPRVLRW